MFNISSFLIKVRATLKDAESSKSEILSVIKNKSNLDIPADGLDIKNNILYIKASPGVKNKIFMFKNIILEECNKIMGTFLVDIR